MRKMNSAAQRPRRVSEPDELLKILLNSTRALYGSVCRSSTTTLLTATSMSSSALVRNFGSHCDFRSRVDGTEERPVQEVQAVHVLLGNGLVIPRVITNDELREEIPNLRSLRFVHEILVRQGFRTSYFVDSNYERFHVSGGVRCAAKRPGQNSDDTGENHDRDLERRVGRQRRAVVLILLARGVFDRGKCGGHNLFADHAKAPRIAPARLPAIPLPAAAVPLNRSLTKLVILKILKNSPMLSIPNGTISVRKWGRV